MPSDIELARFSKFEKELIENDENIWFVVYKKMDEQNPNWPNNPFPVGLYPEVVRSSPCTFEMAGRKIQAPTIQALISKIVRAYESARNERWNTKKETGKAQVD